MMSVNDDWRMLLIIGRGGRKMTGTQNKYNTKNFIHRFPNSPDTNPNPNPNPNPNLKQFLMVLLTLPSFGIWMFSRQKDHDLHRHHHRHHDDRVQYQAIPALTPSTTTPTPTTPPTTPPHYPPDEKVAYASDPSLFSISVSCLGGFINKGFNRCNFVLTHITNNVYYARR